MLALWCVKLPPGYWHAIWVLGPGCSAPNIAPVGGLGKAEKDGPLNPYGGFR